MNEDSQPKSCSRCGVPLAPEALGGLCPRCLMALNLVSETQLPGDDPSPHGAQETPPPRKSPPTPDEIAKHFPQFDIIECLGRGGMGVVYKAVQKSLDRVVALKILAPEREKDPQFAERFAREAKTLAQLTHPNIVTVHDFGEAGGMFYLVMEFVDGVNLRQLLRDRKLAPEEALAIVPPVCDALQYAHNQGVVHRDIKPENLLLDRSGQIKIADFGIAKILGRKGPGSPLGPSEGARPFTRTAAQAPSSGASGERPTQDERVGTPQYMAPEQISEPAKVDHRADIYSLGVVLYEMLTGELPARTLQLPSARMGGVRVDVRIDEIVLRALQHEPERRYQTATQFKTRVETVTGGQPTSPAEAATQNAAPDSTTAPRTAPAFAKTSSGPIWPTVAALSIVIYFAMMVLGVAVIYGLPWGGGLNIALCALSLVALPFIVVIADRRVRHWLYDSQPGEPPPGLHWLKAWGWTAAVLALPVCGFGLFFLNALFSERGHWNPAPDEALLVPLNWLGSVLLPLAGWIMLRTPPGQSAIGNRQSAMGPPQSGINWRVAYTAVAAVLLVAVLTLAGLLAGQADRRARKEKQAADQNMDELRKLAWSNHLTLYRTLTPSDFSRVGAKPERVGDHLKPWIGQPATSAEAPVAQQTNQPFPSSESLPGAVTFHGRYKHRSRGQDIQAPSELWLKETPEGAIAALAQVPFMNSTDLAEGNKENALVRYLSGRDGTGTQPGYRIDLKFSKGAAELTRRGVRQDCDAKELKIPDGALFDPNSRPDSYCAANLLLRAVALGKGESKELHVVDWDNTGEALADYKIRIKNAGKERVEVPAGTFEANHLVLTQVTTGNTWYKKRAGSVTDFWVLDNHVIVRILRAREPYEMLLLDYTVPDKLPGLESANTEKAGALKRW